MKIKDQQIRVRSSKIPNGRFLCGGDNTALTNYDDTTSTNYPITGINKSKVSIYPKLKSKQQQAINIKENNYTHATIDHQP